MINVFAHGIVGRADLPIPAAMFGFAAAMVLVVSFVGLAAGWTKPRLETPRERAWITLPFAVDVVLGVLGVLVFVVAIASCFAGPDNQAENLGAILVFIVFWIGVPCASLVFGDVFRLVNPWRAVGRVVGRVLGGAAEPLPYPERLGRWPAAAGIGCFAIAELCWAQGVQPQTTAVLALIYVAVQFVGMGLYGVEPWCRNGDAFGVFFGLFAAIAPVGRRADGRLVLRRPLTGLVDLPRPPGTIALICVGIGSTMFDGAQEGPLFNSVVDDLQGFFVDLGLSPLRSLEWSFVVGLVACILLVRAIYALGVLYMPKPGPRLGPGLVHTLVPILAAYIVAHYFSSLAYSGQSVWWLASDPFGNGSDLFGTAGGSIDYAVLSATAIWYVQVIALIAGHVAGLVLAHDRALTLYGSAKAATQSQIAMLTLMVGFTSLGLWLLSVSNA